MASLFDDPNYRNRYLSDLQKRREKATTGDPSERASVSQIDTEYQRVYNAYRPQYQAQTNNSLGTSLTNRMQAPTYQAKEYPALSFANALSQANTEIAPLTKDLQARTNRMFQQRRESLPQALNARGQASGGQRIGAGNALVAEQSQSLNQLNLNQNAAALELARRLQERSQDMSMQQGNQDFQRWAAQQGIGLDYANLNRQIGNDEFGRSMTEREFGLQSQGQQFNQDLASRQFGLQSQGQEFQQDLASRQFGLASRQQEFNEMLSAAQLGQDDRKISIAERSQDFNEWAARQGISQDWSRLSQQQKQNEVDNYLRERSLDLQQTQAQQGNLMDIWQTSGQAPAGIPGVQAGTPVYNKTQATDPNDLVNAYQDQIKSISENFEIKPADRKQAIISYIQNLESQGIPENIIDRLLLLNGLPTGK